MWSKPVCTNRKSASAERCLRALGATLAMGIPVMRRSKHSRQGVFSHQGLRKASAADPVNTGLAGSTGMADTNTTPGGYFRAPGAHQYTFALECHTDLLARALGMDPAAFRRMNLVGPGEEDAVGRPLRVAAVRQVLDAALAAGRWGAPKAGPGRGKGVAIFGRQIGGGASGAVLTAEADGTFTVLSPTVDVGTGTHTL